MKILVTYEDETQEIFEEHPEPGECAYDALQKLKLSGKLKPKKVDSMKPFYDSENVEKYMAQDKAIKEEMKAQNELFLIQLQNKKR